MVCSPCYVHLQHCDTLDPFMNAQLIATMHVQVSQMYNWSSVATRTAAVYRHVLSSPDIHGSAAALNIHEGTSSSRGSESSSSACRIISGGDLLARIERYMVCGMWVGAIFSMFAVFGMWWAYVLEAWLQPASSIELAVDWPRRCTAGEKGDEAGRRDNFRSDNDNPGMTADSRHHCSGDGVEDG